MLDRRRYVIKEQIGALRLHDRYDVFDGETGEQLAWAVDEVGVVIQLLRLVMDKQNLPTTIAVHTASDTGPTVLTLERGFTFLRANVKVKDGAGNHLGSFRSKLFSIGGGFYVYDAAGNQAAEVKGD